MVYLDYDFRRKKLNEINEQINEMLNRKEQMIVGSVSPEEERKLDDDIERLRKVMENRQRVVEIKEKELRKSTDFNDKIYRMRYMDGMSAEQISKKLNYSKSQIYRILQEMKKRCDKMRQNF